MDLTYNVMQDVGECPGGGDADEGQGEDDVVEEGDDQHVGHPHPLRVKVGRVGIGLACCCPHIHLDGRGGAGN